ncbi:MAG: GntR family transcriptional regulator [Burkholderiales bacterium]
MASHDVLDSDVPLYHQIYLHLKAEIADGRWVGRDDFPGEVDVARQFGVSVITSRKALGRLADDGFIERSRGRRTRVVRAPESAPAESSPSIFHTEATKGRTFTYEVLERGAAIAPLEACRAFGMPPGTQLWLCRRLRRYEGRPHSVTLNAQPLALGRRVSAAKLGKLPMTRILRGMGVEFVTLRRRVSASLAPPDVAKHLGLTLNDPTLVYTFTHHDERDAVVQWVRIWVRADEPSPDEVFSYKTRTWSASSSM